MLVLQPARFGATFLRPCCSRSYSSSRAICCSSVSSKWPSKSAEKSFSQKSPDICRDFNLPCSHFNSFSGRLSLSFCSRFSNSSWRANSSSSKARLNKYLQSQVAQSRDVEFAFKQTFSRTVGVLECQAPIWRNTFWAPRNCLRVWLSGRRRVVPSLEFPARLRTVSLKGAPGRTCTFPGFSAARTRLSANPGWSYTEYRWIKARTWNLFSWWVSEFSTIRISVVSSSSGLGLRTVFICPKKVLKLLFTVFTVESGDSSCSLNLINLTLWVAEAN